MRRPVVAALLCSSLAVSVFGCRNDTPPPSAFPTPLVTAPPAALTAPEGALLPPGRTRSPGPAIGLSASDGTGLALASMVGRGVIEGPLALTELELTFENTEDRVREGRFHITLPARASVSRFAMKIGDTWQ